MKNIKSVYVWGIVLKLPNISLIFIAEYDKYMCNFFSAEAISLLIAVKNILYNSLTLAGSVCDSVHKIYIVIELLSHAPFSDDWSL